MIKEFLNRIIFNNQKPIDKAVVSKLTIPTPSFIPTSSFLQTEPGLAGVQAQLEAYRSWSHVCVKKKAQRIAAIKLFLYKRKNQDEFEEIKVHEIIDVLDRVNNFMTRYDLLEWTSTLMDLTGECFWWKIKSSGNKINSLYPYFNPRFMDVVPSKDNFVKGYVYTVPGTSNKITFDAEDIIHFKEINPSNPYRGLAPIKAAEYAVASDRETQKWNYNFFKNSAKPFGMLIFPGTLSQEQYDRIKSQWEVGHQGTENAHRVAILENRYPDKSTVDFKEIGFSQKDMDFIEQRKMSRDEIFAIFGVPKGIIMAENSNKASATVEERAFLNDTIIPRMRKIISYLNEFLLMDYDDLFFDFEDPNIQTNEEKLAYYANGISNGWLTPNEIRQEEGYAKVNGGDSLYILSNLLAIGSIQNSKKFKLNTIKQRRTKKEIISELIKTELKPKLKDLISKKNIKLEEIIENKSENTKEELKSSFTQEKRELYGEDFVKKTKEDEKVFKEKVSEYFKEQEKRILKQIKSTKTKTNINLNFDMKQEVGIAIDVFKPLEKLLIQKYGDDAFDILGIDRTFLMNSRVVEFMATTGLKFAKEINEATRDEILEQIKLGEAEGEGILKIKDRIKDIFTEASTTRVLAISQTETARLSNFSKIEGWKQSGVVVGKEWYSAKDDRECPYCASLDGKIISIDDNYFDKGDEFLGNADSPMRFDYADVGFPPAHTNCRCTTLPVIAKQAMVLRKDNKNNK